MAYLIKALLGNILNTFKKDFKCPDDRVCNTCKTRTTQEKYDNLVRKAPRIEDPHVELKKRQTLLSKSQYGPHFCIISESPFSHCPLSSSLSPSPSSSSSSSPSSSSSSSSPSSSLSSEEAAVSITTTSLSSSLPPSLSSSSPPSAAAAATTTTTSATTTA